MTGFLYRRWTAAGGVTTVGNQPAYPPTPAGDDQREPPRQFVIPTAQGQVVLLADVDLDDLGETLRSAADRAVEAVQSRHAARPSAPTITTEQVANGWWSTFPDSHLVRVLDNDGRIVFQNTLGAVRSTLGIEVTP